MNYGAEGRRSNSGGGSMITKVLVFVAVLAGLFWGFNGSEEGGGDYEDEIIDVKKEYALPTSTTGQVIHHNYYSLSYSEEHEQAEWVAYELYRENLEGERVPRSNNFREDRAVKTGSSNSRDFSHPDYDRGHLVPAADMNFNETAMSETFFMSNMSPQKNNFNQGIWRELEENTRYWAKKFKRLFVVTGPVLSRPIIRRIGNNKVSVPAAYFKVLLDIDDPEKKGIGFIMPNAVSYEPIETYAVSIDEVEELTGINFFGELLEPDLEAQLESEYDPSLWSTSKKKFQLRKNKWNKVGQR